MAKKKRHHYVPRFYLKGFIDPDNRPYIWIYEKGNPIMRKETAKNIAFEKDYYSFTTPEGEKDSETFENILATIERMVAPTFRKIKSHQSLKDQKRSSFAVFLAFSMTRVPSFRENIERAMAEFMKKMNMILASNPQGFRSMIEKFEKDRGSEIGMSVE